LVGRTSKKERIMLHLHLLRHAKTEQISPTGRDFDRYLMPKGLRQRADLETFFAVDKGIRHVWCSSSKRTRETIETMLNGKLPEPIYSDDLYLCSHKTMLKMIWDSGVEGDILIVGHNYGISDLANYFCDSDIELRTGQYVRVSFETDNWAETSRGTGTIAEMYRPEV